VHRGRLDAGRRGVMSVFSLHSLPGAVQGVACRWHLTAFPSY
jgi:hypothetical protein